MPLPIYETADAVPVEFRELYHEIEGKWQPNLPDVTGAMTALATERQKAKDALKAQRVAEEKLADAERTQAAKDAQVPEEVLRGIREAEAAKTTAAERERDEAKAENRRLKLTDRVRTLALKHGVMADRIDDAMVLLDTRTDLGDEGGLVVKDAKGVATAESVDVFLGRTFKEEKPWLYAGSDSSGSGSTQSKPGAQPGASRANHTKTAQSVYGAL